MTYEHMRLILPDSCSNLLLYDIAEGVTAFSPLKDAALPMHVVQAHQVHGDRVAVVRSAALTREDLDGFDALITDVPGVAVGARTADCIPVLMYDPVHRAVAAVHSGWKGTVLKIAAKTLAAMSGEFGTRPADILAVIGLSGYRSRHRPRQLPGRSRSRPGLPRRRLSGSRTFRNILLRQTDYLRPWAQDTRHHAGRPAH